METHQILRCVTRSLAFNNILVVTILDYALSLCPFPLSIIFTHFFVLFEVNVKNCQFVPGFKFGIIHCLKQSPPSYQRRENGRPNKILSKARRQQMDPVCITQRVRTEQVPHRFNYSWGRQKRTGDHAANQSTCRVVMSGKV